MIRYLAFLLLYVLSFYGGYVQYHNQGVLYQYIQNLARDIAFLQHCFSPRYYSINNLFIPYKPTDPPLQSTYQSQQTYPGLTAFCQGDDLSLHLIDMNGKGIHQWKIPPSVHLQSPTISQHPLLTHLSKPLLSNIRDYHIYPNGDALLIITQRFITPWGGVLVKIDKNSNLLWIKAGHFHHQMTHAPDGRIFILSHQMHQASIGQKKGPFLHADLNKPYLEDMVITLDAAGHTIAHDSLLKAMMQWAKTHTIQSRHADTITSFDPLHINSITFIDSKTATYHPDLKVGNLLIYARNIDTLIHFNPNNDQIENTWRGPWLQAHQPLFIDKNQLVVFDNQSQWPTSRLIWYDLQHKKIIKTFTGTGWPLASYVRGSIQPLPNKNLLITSSEQGRILEITPANKVVWEYHNHHPTRIKGNYYRPIIVSAKRYSKAQLPFLANKIN